MALKKFSFNVTNIFKDSRCGIIKTPHGFVDTPTFMPVGTQATVKATFIKDIIEFIRVGSSMVQIGTLNYRDPSKINKLYDDLRSFLIKEKIASISELVGNYNDN